MRERPILFNGEMVRAILDGRKTQTRRVIKGVDGTNWLKGANNHVVHCADLCPYGQPGDRLWVRETWCRDWEDGHTHYKADGHDVNLYDQNGVMSPGRSPWKPSIHMFRQFSRITLEVTAVRVEQVQAISNLEARSEGCEPDVDEGVAGCKQKFAVLWDSINAKRGYSWDSNPWVWVVEFRRQYERTIAVDTDNDDSRDGES